MRVSVCVWVLRSTNPNKPLTGNYTRKRLVLAWLDRSKTSSTPESETKANRFSAVKLKAEKEK